MKIASNVLMPKIKELLDGCKGDFYTFLDITSYKKPMIKSTAVVQYEQNDLTFDFELFGGTFDGISARPILEAEDYTFRIRPQRSIKHLSNQSLKQNQKKKSSCFLV